MLGVGFISPLQANTLSSPPAESVVTIEGIDYPVFKISDLEPVSRVEPKYPLHEGERGKAGNVLIVVLVDRDGKPAEVMLKLSEPSPNFGEAAVKAVKKWRFRPAMWRGAPTEYIMQVPLVFRVAR